MADKLPQQPSPRDQNPTEISIGTITHPEGGTRITLSIVNNVVQSIIAFTPKEAGAIGEALQKAARQVETGLLVPAGSGLIS